MPAERDVYCQRLHFVCSSQPALCCFSRMPLTLTPALFCFLYKIILCYIYYSGVYNQYKIAEHKYKKNLAGSYWLDLIHCSCCCCFFVVLVYLPGIIYNLRPSQLSLFASSRKRRGVLLAASARRAPTIRELIHPGPARATEKLSPRAAARGDLRWL